MCEALDSTPSTLTMIIIKASPVKPALKPGSFLPLYRTQHLLNGHPAYGRKYGIHEEKGSLPINHASGTSVLNNA